MTSPSQTRSHRLVCEMCGEPFLVKPRYREVARFCSRRCHGAAKYSESLALRIEENSMPVTECGCWIWMLSTHRHGHGQLTYRYQHLAAHRCSYEAFKGPIPEEMHVLHRCNIPQCVNPDHLYLGKDLENAWDRIAAGTQVNPPTLIGSEHPNSKLTEDVARQIKNSRGTAKEVAARFGCHFQTVHQIRSGRQWRHV